MTDKLNFQIIGNGQVVEINLEPDKALIADGGALLYLDEEISFVLRNNDGADEVKEEIEEEANFVAEAEPEADFTWDNPSIMNKVFEEPEEDDKNEGLLEKLWQATKKTITRLGKIGEKKGEEPNQEDNFNWGNPAFEENTYENNSTEPKEPEFSWYLTQFTNDSEYIRKIAFTTTTSGIPVAIDLAQTFENELIIQTGSFLCARKGTRLEKFLDTGISMNFVKEKYFKLDKLKSNDIIFLRAEGSVIEKELENDAIRVNLFSLLAFESSLDLDTNKLQLVQSMNYEDETMFATLVGTGKYWLQTSNLQHLIYRITPFIFESSEGSSSVIPESEKPSTNSLEDFNFGEA